MKSEIEIPGEVSEAAAKLVAAGFEAYLVGGCVRDILLGRAPKDWDVATNATPEEIQKLFEDTVYENDFGTVGVKTESKDPKLKVIEVTTYRIEGGYTDQRHPDDVRFAKTIEEDLSRRDFTVNALALRSVSGGGMALGAESQIVDPFHGQDDLKKKIIRTVGKPEERFGEDALRLMRAVRFAAELDFTIEPETRRAVEKMSGGLASIAKERVRDELLKILQTPDAARGILLLEELGLLKYILPELREGIGVAQNLHHIYTVFEHNIRALDYAAKQNYPVEIRMASLLHDVGKPRSKQGEGERATFYQHEYIGAKMTAKALDRLRFPKDFIDQVSHLVRTHMFYYNTGEVSDAGVRRLVKRMGPENIEAILRVREADRIGSGVRKAVPYKLRHLLFMMEKVKRDPLSPKMLAVGGDDLMQLLGMAPSPRLGWIIAALLEEVLDDPARNTKEYLEQRAKAFAKLSDAELQKLAAASKEKKEEMEEDIEQDIKNKFHV